MRRIINLTLVLLPSFWISSALGVPSPLEEMETLKELEGFYSYPANPEVMNHRPQKYGVATGNKVEINTNLKLPHGETPLTEFEKMAQRKTSASFQINNCKQLKKHMPTIVCPSDKASDVWSSVEGGDKVTDLAKTWVGKVETSIDSIPTKGEANVQPWSDDYWKIKWGTTSYRYAESQLFPTYREAVESYQQPKEWRAGAETLNLTELSKKVAGWSPAEKYDLSVADVEFGMTTEQKEEGSSMLGPDGDVESWMGICHGWAAAAIMAPRAQKSTDITGTGGVTVTWYPHDVRAITSLAWANGNHSSNFIGGRCGKKNPERFENGRVKDQECFDNNPASFHLALGNLLGKEKVSFVMDAAYDYEVWNQPLQSYEFTYFNPKNPRQQSKDWKEVAVAYDDEFKSADRFQKPLTRGIRTQSNGTFNDTKIQKIVGVIARVVYLGEITPISGDIPKKDQLVRVTYTYDLELSDDGAGMVITGGEWHSNAHPDFLWVPRKGVVAQMPFDRNLPSFTGVGTPDTKLTQTAKQASRYGYPLCKVVAELLKRTGSEINYECPN